MDNYEKSNSIETLPNLNLSASTRRLFVSLREKVQTSQNDLQSVANAICGDLNVKSTPIHFGGVQNHSVRGGKIVSKTLGNYTTGVCSIRIFELTAARKQKIAPKTAFDTLLHELMHHFDLKVLGLQSTIHSAGFYKRIGSLKAELLK
jgi:hypothetical protein